MKQTKFIGKNLNSKVFIGKNGEFVTSADKCQKFDSVGDCMRACISANELIGTEVFKFEKIYE